ncbi:uncharacterized protein SAPINGB_P003106 [Magnusiomyces paraingens]|uniref:SPX domain-containing protein n=1 Tax=Magnusiomyces paraingens TaxID=2606893 RepID=A0A5E8BP60_9ASCO|nr:uncharacterized protein SAPINGB_P003106 [Saprochaete ingens]VVT51468.1 unnamed protein product [Saprochaete ingens]
MLFGVRLANEIYPPWRDAYVQYEVLKKLLKENVIPVSEESWTPDDETNFVEALDKELEKVYSFQTKTYESLSDRLATIEKSINNSVESHQFTEDDGKALESDLEEILEEAKQLDRFSRLNFTGFTKIVKKHDRLHSKYQVKPLLQVRLNALPFHSEDYSPLLYRISVIYAFLAENLTGADATAASASAKLSSVTNSENSDYTTYKFWVHPDNVMEVKTRILRHLPLLVYGSKSHGETDDAEAHPQHDPTITSLYFDNPNFDLYEAKLQKNDVSPSLRIRWSGKLTDKPDITIEKKVIDHTSSSGDYIPDERIEIKEKYIQQFITGKYHMEKTVQKLKARGSSQHEVDEYQKTVTDLQDFIAEHDLQPVVRTVYTRSAFQIPGDNRVRAILDSDIVFIREDSFDKDRPVRDPENWHRSDIDVPGVENPFSILRKGEYVKFPFAVLEIRVLNKGDPTTSTLATTPGTSVKSISALVPTKRHGKWISELTKSHLVKEVPKFSKFIQGIASLFAEDDRLDLLPFWLHLLEHDIRQDPKQAWEEQRRRIQESKQASVESDKLRLLTSRSSPRVEPVSSPKVSAAGPSSAPVSSGTAASSSTPVSETTEVAPTDEDASKKKADEYDDDSDLDDDDSDLEDEEDLQHLSRKARGKKLLQRLAFWPSSGPRLEGDSEDEEIILPPGVVKPNTLLRQSGPVNVEVKVWLANERTFNRWLHVSVLFSALTFTLYSSVNKARDQTTATLIAYILFGITVFSCLWGYGTYLYRLKHIRNRSEMHLDNPTGPIVIALGLLACLTLNFVANYNNKVLHPKNPKMGGESLNSTVY